MQRKKFCRIVKQTNDARLRTRYLIVLGYDDGKGSATIARELCCAHSTPHRVARRYMKLGEAGLIDARCDNGMIKADEKTYAVLVHCLEQSPQDYGWSRPTWTRELLAKQIAKETQVTLSVSTISTMLRKIGARLKRPKPVVCCPWSARKRNKRLREIQEVLDHTPPNEVVLYEDEVDVHLNPKIGPDWMLPGTQKTVLTPGRNDKRYVAGALDARSGDIHYVDGDSKCSALFVELVLWLANKCYAKARRIHLIVDNYVIHTSKITQKAIEALDGRVVLHFLPPYCPDSNHIELLWKQLHDNVTRNHRCTSIDELMQEVRDFLRSASPFPGSQPSLRKKA